MAARLTDRDWDRLIREIDREKVVLVLGDRLSKVKFDDKAYTMKDYVLKRMAEMLDIDPDDNIDFSHLSYEYNKKKWQDLSSDPYNETTYILEDIEPQYYDTEYLRKLLSIDKFKLVLTTGFDDIALHVMRGIYGPDRVKSYSYVKNSNGPDIPTKSDHYIHYQIFGKADPARHSFVLTEDDLLEFIHSWMDQNFRPEQLSYKLRDRYLLVIGCDYPNWLFRFFFHSLKYSAVNFSRKEDSVTGALADNDLEPELISFLQRMEASVHEDTQGFIDELTERWQKYKATHTTDTSAIADEDSSLPGEEPAEAFISYASEDYETAKEIADTFKALGLKVWFDKKDLGIGDKYEKLIERRIKQCKVFIPILSPNTGAAIGGRFFRKEWKWAVEASAMHFGLNDSFIMPVTIGGYKMDEDHPFIHYHAEDLSVTGERRGKIRGIIRKFRQIQNR